MFLRGRIFKDPNSEWFCSEFLPFCIYTQGTSKDDAFDMLKDAISEAFPELVFSLAWDTQNEGDVLLNPATNAEAIAIIIRQNRNDNDLSRQKLAELLGSANPGSIQCYENASREASLSKLDELMAALKKKVIISIVDDEVA